MKLTIGGKEYTFVYSIEASLCEECVEKTTGIMVKIGQAQNEGDIAMMVSSMSNVPQTALSMFYAGLLEKHSNEIRSKDDAKKLLKQYLIENSDDESANFYGILTMVIDQMGEDGFFKLIGVEQLIKESQGTNQTEETPKKRGRKPTLTVSEN